MEGKHLVPGYLVFIYAMSLTNISCLYMFPPNDGASSTEQRACSLKWCTTTDPLRIEDTKETIRVSKRFARPDMFGLWYWWSHRPFVKNAFQHPQQDMLQTNFIPADSWRSVSRLHKPGVQLCSGRFPAKGTARGVPPDLHRWLVSVPFLSATHENLLISFSQQVQHLWFFMLYQRGASWSGRASHQPGSPPKIACLLVRRRVCVTVSIGAWVRIYSQGFFWSVCHCANIDNPIKRHLSSYFTIFDFANVIEPSRPGCVWTKLVLSDRQQHLLQLTQRSSQAIPAVSQDTLEVTHMSPQDLSCCDVASKLRHVREHGALAWMWRYFSASQVGPMPFKQHSDPLPHLIWGYGTLCRLMITTRGRHDWETCRNFSTNAISHNKPSSAPVVWGDAMCNCNGWQEAFYPCVCSLRLVFFDSELNEARVPLIWIWQHGFRVL